MTKLLKEDAGELSVTQLHGKRQFCRMAELLAMPMAGSEFYYIKADLPHFHFFPLAFYGTPPVQSTELKPEVLTHHQHVMIQYNTYVLSGFTAEINFILTFT